MQLGMVAKTHRWKRSLRLDEDTGKSLGLNDGLHEENSTEISKLVDEAQGNKTGPRRTEKL